jgi:hypothetical protein
MFYDFKRTTEILKQLDITANQAWFCVMLLEPDFDYKLELFNKYINSIDNSILFDDIQILEEKGYIENCSNTKLPKTIVVKRTIEYAGSSTIFEIVKSKDVAILELFIVTPKFKEQVYIEAEAAAEELLKIYPAWISIKDKQSGRISRQSIKMIEDRDAFYEMYHRVHTQGDILKHRYICDMFSHYRRLVSEGKVQGMNILKALESRLYQDIEQLLEEENGNKDTITDI